MPHMQRLTWEGIALHAGKLPGYRRATAMSASRTQVGTPIIIAGDTTDPAAVKDPGPLLGSEAKQAMDIKAGKKKASAGGAGAVTAILVSRADNRMYVLQNGAIVAEGDANIEDPSKPLGSNVFVWQGGDLEGSTWEGMGFYAEAEGAVAPNTAVIERIEGSPEVMEAIKKRIKPGTVLVTTDLPATPDTRTAKDFVVMDGPVR